MARLAGQEVDIVLAVRALECRVERRDVGMLGVDPRMALMVRSFRIETHLGALLKVGKDPFLLASRKEKHPVTVVHRARVGIRTPDAAALQIKSLIAHSHNGVPVSAKFGSILRKTTLPPS
jgi:hypothetical protein